MKQYNIRTTATRILLIYVETILACGVAMQIELT